MRQAVQMDIRVGRSDAMLDVLIAELVPELVADLRPAAWRFDRDFIRPHGRVRISFFAPFGASPGRARIERQGVAAVRRLASVPDVAESQLVSLPLPDPGPEREGGTVVDVRDVEIDETEPILLDEWSSKCVLGTLPMILGGELNRKTLAPAHVATLAEWYSGANRSVDGRQWLGVLVQDALTNINAISLLPEFEAKSAALVASGAFVFRKRFEAASAEGKHLASLRDGLPRRRIQNSCSDRRAVGSFILRHIVRLGFNLVEACYILTLAMAEIADAD